VQDQHPRLEVDPPAEQRLLLIAAAQRREATRRQRRIHVEVMQDAPDRRPLAYMIDPEAPAVVVQRRQGHVLLDRRPHDAPATLAVGGQETEAGRPAALRAQAAKLLAPDHHGPLRGRLCPVHEVGDLVVPGPDESRQAEHLALVYPQRDVARDGARHLPHLEHRLGRRGLDRRVELAEITAEDELDQPTLVELVRRTAGDELSVAQDGDAIAELEHFREAVADEEHGRAGCRDATDRVEQLADLAFGQRDRRLIENEHTGGARRLDVLERSHDPDDGPLGLAEARDRRLRVDVEIKAPQELAGAPALLAPPDAAAHSGLELADTEVLENRDRLDEPEVLVHEADAEPTRPARRDRQLDLLAADGHRRARVRRVIAGEDLDERRLA
jgi:hypothetical protein